MKHAIPDVATARRCIDALADYLATKDESPRAASDLREAVRLLSDDSRAKALDLVEQEARRRAEEAQKKANQGAEGGFRVFSPESYALKAVADFCRSQRGTP